MKLEQRQIHQYLWDDEIIAQKMAFLSGPRQVGKTTYAKWLLQTKRQGAYYNWDNRAVRSAYAKDPFFFTHTASGRDYLVVFDEIHKQPKWKDILKGIYDSIDPLAYRLLVTGSARLEWFRKSGDSLLGRYAHFHMLPVSLGELLRRPLNELWLGTSEDWKDPRQALQRRLEGRPRALETRSGYEHLLRYSGFPEPLSRGSDRFFRKWRQDYLSLILREDLRDLSRVRATDTVERLIALLPERVGSPLSINSLARDLRSTHPTVMNYLAQLEKLWLLFSIKPWSRRVNRSLRKEKKTYFANWRYAAAESAIFENFLAASLLRACIVWTDCGNGEAALWFVRNFDGSEADFLITCDNAPVLLVETKLSETRVAPSLRRFGALLAAPFIQVVHAPGIFRREEGGYVMSADRFLLALP